MEKDINQTYFPTLPGLELIIIVYLPPYILHYIQSYTTYMSYYHAWKTNRKANAIIPHSWVTKYIRPPKHT